MREGEVKKERGGVGGGEGEGRKGEGGKGWWGMELEERKHR